MIGIGGLIGFFMFFSLEFKLNLLLLISFLFVLAGVIAFSRIKLKAHQNKEVFWGGLIGVFSELTVYFIYNI
jgi:membrane-associated phospholipid phosphatase